MAILTGTTGSVAPTTATDWPKFGGATSTYGAMSLTSWTASIECDEFEVSTYNSTTNYKDFIRGMASISGSAEGFIDSASAIGTSGWSEQDPVGISLELMYSTGDKITITKAFARNFRFASAKNGPNTVSFDFRGTGSWATAQA